MYLCHFLVDDALKGRNVCHQHDFLTLAFPQAFGQSTTIELLINGILCVFGLIGVWIIWRLREAGDLARAGEEITRL